ncbi:hypothetical protein BH10CYA1_BH10CYA1_19620 [soil metagenome]
MLQGANLPQIPYIAEPLGDSTFTSCEQQYHLAMVEMRQRNLSSFSAESKMPFALKQRQIELPMLEYSVSLALSSPKWRQVVVRALLENIEKGPGHLSVHRAKDALKQIAASIGLTNLSSMIYSHEQTEAEQAAHLLGWLKNPRAAQPLLDSIHREHLGNQLITKILELHYPAYKP